MCIKSVKNTKCVITTWVLSFKLKMHRNPFSAAEASYDALPQTSSRLRRIRLQSTRSNKCFELSSEFCAADFLVSQTGR